ncbi:MULTISPECIES: hypothetical protein [unclassified Arsenophonus]|uniref:hypothetical protein n=1 Tax=unclassified Arsenophonus TaxID=2627083 RepID=UPI00285DF221|nr:hypothetical protein [Arsenophonus sp.]MDR5610418.1 hypothetical protein [Arsenophonus sp.]
MLQANITLKKPIELDTEEGLLAFNYFRNKVIEEMKKRRLKIKKTLLQNDCYICNLLMRVSGFDAIIRKEFIKFDPNIRKIKYYSRIPNCRIICVKDPMSAIGNRISVEKKGDV